MKRKLQYNKISTYFKLNIGVVILFAITGTLFNVSVAFLPTIQGYLIDSFSADDPFDIVLKLGLFYIGAVLFIQINRFLKRLLRRKFNNKMVVQMRKKAFNNLLFEDIDKFTSDTYADIMNRQLQDIKDASSAIETVMAETFDSGVLLISYFIFMGIKSWWLAGVCMGFAILSIIISVFVGPFVRKYTREYKKSYSETKKENITVLQNEVYYRGFGINKNYYDKYEKSLNVLEKKAVRNTIFRTAFEPFYLIVGALSYIFIFYFGGKMVLDDVWTVGTLTAFIASYSLVRKKSGFIGRIINNIQNGFVSWDRCKTYLKDNNNSKILDTPNEINNLVVKSLTFGYDDTFQIKDISFEAKPGDVIGVCGRIRSGKTTLVGALSGIYDYEGSIKLSGIEIKDIRDDRIKSFIHIAPGKVEIFNDTLKYNITFGEDGDFNKAIDTACLNEDLEGFPNKENEALSHSLLNISGGQQRRLQIARSVYGSPKLVVLDDPFNAIGISMSIEIINKLKKNYPNTIFVIINNQKESLSLSNKILYLENNTGVFDTFDNLNKIPSFNKLMGGVL